ncbi:MAG TPA: alpha/beta hydrolase, partial [Cyclobacteriaceae bacterium]|nr:alpha/beta hydrolase [Cyclobacteriaceae bacterium]
MKEVYLIPGLGADRRVFQYLNLAEHSISHISWIEPLPNESIEQYAGRLTEQIKSPDPILVGVSFGGMIAVEIAKQIKTNKIILISSART